MPRFTGYVAILAAAFAAGPAMAATRPIAAAFGSEVAFEANAGQHDARVRFVARGRRDALLVTSGRGVLLLPNAKGGNARTALRFGLDGARADATCRGEYELSGHANYYLGNDPSRWRTDIARFARVVCSDVRPGVDVVYYGRDGRIEWDVVVAPGADASNLFVRFDGVDSMSIANDGSLALRGAFGTLSQHAPHAFQRDGGVERPIEAKWTVAEGGARLALGVHDARLALVVDPVIEYATPLGGSGSENAAGVGVDAAGNVHVVGDTTSVDFPGAGGVPAGSRDVFWAVLSHDGSTLLHATYFGGSGDDVFAEDFYIDFIAKRAGGVAVFPDGGVTIVASTRSPDLPTTPSAPQPTWTGSIDAFVARFAPGGTSLLWATYLGGIGEDYGNGVARDAAGNVYVVGTTHSIDFPVRNALYDDCHDDDIFIGCFDAFVTKIAADGSDLVYSTYLGGSAVDRGFGIAVDAFGLAYVVGWTESSNFPLKDAFQSTLQPGGLCSQFYPCPDAFVTKLLPTGQGLVFSTFLGGYFFDSAQAVAVHPGGAVLVAGFSEGGNFPLVNAAQPVFGGVRDGFVAFFNGSGSQLRYSTFLGGSQAEAFSGAAIDAQGVATLVGTTGPLATSSPGHDALIAQLGPTGVLGSMQTLGGSGEEFGFGVALDAGANPWFVGATSSADFPSVDPLQPVRARDAFVAKLVPAPGELACNVDFSQPNYTNGQTVQVTSLRFRNTTLLPKRVRLRLTLAPPGQSAFTAADLTTWFAPGFSADLAPVNLFAVAPGVPRGQITMRCELLDAADGTIRAEDDGVIQIQ